MKLDYCRNMGGSVVTAAVVFLAGLWMIYLLYEAKQAKRARSKMKHIVHVNGTRGKSSVSRLIEAGLRAGGMRVFCKTTGTDPMTIDVLGREEPIIRRAGANIKEQVEILRRAAAQDAEVLVVECMAIRPELQYAAQHKILKADIGVITNVRRDHTDVMGETLGEIARALSNTVPERGVLFTAERESKQVEILRMAAQRLGTQFIQTLPDGGEPNFDFAENIALALRVCEHLGVARETALMGMRQYHRDPYALSIHRWGQSVFINGFSINDVQSICMVWDKVRRERKLEEKRLILLVNNRSDRGSRTKDMVSVCALLAPAEIWLLGAAGAYMKHRIEKELPQCAVKNLKNAAAISDEYMSEDAVIFAVGNIADEGRRVIQRVREEGEELVP